MTDIQVFVLVLINWHEDESNDFIRLKKSLSSFFVGRLASGVYTHDQNHESLNYVCIKIGSELLLFCIGLDINLYQSAPPINIGFYAH